MVVFLMLFIMAKSLRAQLPALPVITKEVHRRETAQCQACGGGIEYDAGDFACVCPYCHVENFRVQFVRNERAREEKQTTQVKSVLFHAMQIIDDYVMTFVMFSGIFGVAFIILFGFGMIKALLRGD